jgi:tRNA pseudouridine55 synthase
MKESPARTIKEPISRNSNRTDFDFMEEGEVLLVDKPKEWSSFDVVNKLRRIFHVRRMGHGGTLDPLASGLLILFTARQTKSMEHFLGLSKEYRGTLQLGIRTASFDLETEIQQRSEFKHITREMVETAIKEFVGAIRQRPPMYSAVKRDGKTLYKLARRGEHVERNDREVEVQSFVVERFDPPLVEFTVVCSKGTYIRVLAEDLGLRLGCGAALIDLRRTKVGTFSVDDAFTVVEAVELGRRYQKPIAEAYGHHT